ncbi:Bacterial regulatory protein, tetR family [Calidithermus roseus]|uniref:Bacterial regulatory protein, tetR family n=1 Tax=Calidithermus roseus TaxID=1644118 RepID=A0A399EXA6_9DEIN|nr:Bacterial regulatory protein, tetR family [Calidithermus roseus]
MSPSSSWPCLPPCIPTLENDVTDVTLVGMGRQPEPHKRSELLEKAVDYVLENGLQGLSLRPLARRLGTNARMLIYHFESKEKLITEVLQAAQARQRALLQGLSGGAADPYAALEAFWRWFTSPRMAPFARLLYEVEVGAMQGQHEYRSFARQAIHGWIGFVLQGLPGSTPAQASLIVGTIAGLLLDWLITGEEERVNAAFGAFLEVLRKGGLA